MPGAVGRERERVFSSGHSHMHVELVDIEVVPLCVRVSKPQRYSLADSGPQLSLTELHLH